MWFNIIKSTTYYHVTRRNNAENIIKEGRIKQGHSRGDFGSSGIWVWGEYEDAYDYFLDGLGTQGTREELISLGQKANINDKVILKVELDVTPENMDRHRDILVTWTGKSGAKGRLLNSAYVYRDSKDLVGKFTIIYP